MSDQQRDQLNKKPSKTEKGCCGGEPVTNSQACCVADEKAKQQGKSGCGCDCSSSPSTK